MQAQNRTHRNFEPPGVQHHNAEESHQQGNNEVDNREPVHMIFRDIVVPSSEVRYGGKGQPHLQGGWQWSDESHLTGEHYVNMVDRRDEVH